MPEHLNAHIKVGRSVLGIFVIGHEASLGVIIADLALIWDAAQPGEFDNQIVYLPL